MIEKEQILYLYLNYRAKGFLGFDWKKIVIEIKKI